MFMLLVGWNGLIAINIYLRLLLRQNVYISENISHWVTGRPANFTSGRTPHGAGGDMCSNNLSFNNYSGNVIQSTVKIAAITPGRTVVTRD